MFDVNSVVRSELDGTDFFIYLFIFNKNFYKAGLFVRSPEYKIAVPRCVTHLQLTPD